MQADNVIARCRWQSTFDREAQAGALQDVLSHWSNTGLTEELDRCFNTRCPADQTWRIERLHLDLGEIELDELTSELPQRFRVRLHEAIDRLLSQQAFADDDAGQPNFRILQRNNSPRDFLAWYLQHGCAPWWSGDSLDALQVFDQLLAVQPEAVGELLRDLGQSDVVRKRVVWQLGEARVRSVVHLLEPWQGTVVCAYADQLLVVQSRHRVPDVDPSSFSTQVWLSILGYLLIDRGTLFNTISFMRASVWRTAQHYRIDPRMLLAQMAGAVQALRPSGVINVGFLTAIETLHGQEQAARVVTHTDSTPADRWAHWQLMLRHGQTRRTIEQDSVRYTELFAALAGLDPARMTALLYQEGAALEVRHGLLRHLDASGLDLLARLLAPQAHRFVVAYADQAEQLMRAQRWKVEVVWQTVLACLLSTRGSDFNRRQLVRDTLQQLCSAHGYSFEALLNLLIHSVSVAHAAHRFELLAVLRRLQSDLLQQPTAVEAQNLQWRGLLSYLNTGSRSRRGRHSWTHRFAVLLADPVTPEARNLLGDLLRSPQLRGVSDRVLSQRLLSLAGAVDWLRLVAWLDPDAVDYCHDLSRRLLDGCRRGHLPCLARLDPGFQLPALLIQSLPALHMRHQRSIARFNSAVFWRQLSSLLERQAGVDTAALHRQLADYLLSDPLWGAAQTVVAFELPVTQTGHPVDPVDRTCVDAQQQLLLDLTQEKSVALDRWIEHQPDRYQALNWLSAQQHVAPVADGMLTFLPVGLKRPQVILKQWRELLGDCWQGAQALLEEQLAQVFWSVSFDARDQHLSAAQLLARMTVCASLRLNISVVDMLAAYRTRLPAMAHSSWHDACACLLQQSPAHGDQPASVTDLAAGVYQQDYSGLYLRDARLPEVARHFLFHGRVPASGSSAPSSSAVAWDLTRLLHDLFHVRPDLLPAVLKESAQHPAALFRLTRIVPFAWLAHALRSIAPQRQVLLMLLDAFHRCLSRIELPGASAQQCEALLFQRVLDRSMVGDWAALEPEPLVDNVFNQLIRQRPVSPAAVYDALAPHRSQLPKRLRQALDVITNGTKKTTDTPAAAVQKPRVPSRPTHMLDIPMILNNAGLVIVQGYITRLFALQGLVEKGAFVSEDAQRRAVHCLQYLVNGRTDTPEQYLMLNKLLCGLAVTDPVEAEITLSDAEKKTMDEMLVAVINHWPAIGKSSVEGLRGNWFVRDGLLQETQDRWDLKVHHRPYDMLLDRSPYTFSVIRFPWMPKALYVTWPT
ncbi:hypothetical protein K0038_01246 [Pseudomonas syringae]|uniref:contractile injection system tape measure protein n=1 Tax=Pseudomonas syringae TaxID=317 RepID=UPI001CAA06CF|nr:contractile injection system tape measure protein [Pseudomonas syringae]MCI3944238.1 hypothetical protein [Pseudomonas syringae]